MGAGTLEKKSKKEEKEMAVTRVNRYKRQRCNYFGNVVKKDREGHFLYTASPNTSGTIIRERNTILCGRYWLGGLGAIRERDTIRVGMPFWDALDYASVEDVEKIIKYNVDKY